MTCDAAGLLLVQIGRNNPIDAKLKGVALEHARYCRACGSRLANERMLSAGFDLLIEENAELKPLPALEATVMVAYGKKFAAQQKVRMMWSAVAALAACVSLVTLGQTIRLGNGRVTPMGDIQTLAPGASAEFAAIATDAANTGDTAEGPFIPIPYAEPIAPDERTELQRVKLTRGTLSAMGMAMGVPTETSDVDEPMNAELVVGEDGVPRAVRILN